VTALHRHLANEVGRRRKVLVERGGGHTEHYAEVRFEQQPPPGTIREIFIAGHDGRRLLAA
jgi:threonylcarbamoyladenosine tRNA methylthiotransferase MtaB